MQLSRMWWPRPTVAQALSRKLEQYEDEARFITGVQRLLPVSLLTKELYTQYYRNLTASWGDFGRRARTILLNFGKIRTSRFYDKGGYGTARSRILVFLSDFEIAMDLKGPLLGVDPEDLHNCLTLLIDEAIGQMDVMVVLIDDKRVPTHVLEHYSKHDAVVAFDDAFVMKIHRNTLSRSWCERCQGPEQAIYIDDELKMINELLKYRTHDLKIDASVRSLRKYLPE